MLKQYLCAYCNIGPPPLKYIFVYSLNVYHHAEYDGYPNKITTCNSVHVFQVGWFCRQQY